MKTLTLLTITFVAVSCLAQAPAADSLQVGVTVSHLKDQLYTVTCTGGAEFNQPIFEARTVASVGPDGILLVDAGFGSTAETLLDTLKQMGNGRLKMVINTHSHGDHSFGNHVLKSEAVVIAHRNVINLFSGDYFHLEGPANPNQPHVGFGDSLQITFNDDDIRVVHTPACHSSSDAYVYFTKAKIVAVGDLFFPDETPYVSVGVGGNIAGYHQQVKRFITDFPDDVTFIATHGRPYNKDDLRAYDTMLAGTVGAVRQAMSDGKTLDEMIQDSVLAPWNDWDGSFPTTTLEAWIRAVYAEETTTEEWRQSICEPLTASLVEGTVQDVVDRYRELKETQPDAYDYGEAHLNMLGYQLLAHERVADAVAVFALNVEAFPEAFNTYDSYGEALMLSGDTTGAITNYEKSLELNPDNTNAVEMLKKLRP